MFSNLRFSYVAMLQFYNLAFESAKYRWVFHKIILKFEYKYLAGYSYQDGSYGNRDYNLNRPNEYLQILHMCILQTNEFIFNPAIFFII